MPDRILHHADCQDRPLADFVASVRRRQGRRGGQQSDAAASAPVVEAEINHGRWIARCPFCAGAELVDLADLRFWCLSCDMTGGGGRWLPVKLPAQRAAIEAALCARPDAANRNWRPGESLTRLRRENADRGLPPG